MYIQPTPQALLLAGLAFSFEDAGFYSKVLKEYPSPHHDSLAFFELAGFVETALLAAFVLTGFLVFEAGFAVFALVVPVTAVYSDNQNHSNDGELNPPSCCLHASP